MPDDPKRYLIYARQSITRDDEESLSLETQVRAGKEYIQRQGGQLVGVFEDPDAKGWKTSRPGFDQMLQRFRDGTADVAVVFKLSRFARTLIHQETVLTEVAEAGGELVSVMEPYLNTSPMVRQILGAVNEQYHRDQSDFLTAAFAGRARRGFHHGYAPIGYQLRDGRLVVDDATAGTVRRMFTWAAAGLGSPEITHRLNVAGTRTQTGKPWSQVSTLRVLRNATYTGVVVHRGEVVARDTHPAIIDADTFTTVQANIDRRRGVRRKTAPSWIDGLVHHACGTRMYCASWSTAGDAARWRFRCGATVASKRHNRHRCTITPASIFADRAEAIVRDQLTTALETIADPREVAERIEASRHESARARDTTRRRLERRHDELTRQRDKLLDMVLAGRVDDDLYTARDRTLKTELEALRDQIDAVPAPVDISRLEAQHSHLVATAAAVQVGIHHQPDAVVPLLHRLDVRLVIGDPAGPVLRFGPDIAPFLDGG